MRTSLFLCLCLLVLCPAAAFANGITSISYEGSGCPAGTVGQSISDDRTTVTLVFDQLVASIGPNIDESESVKDCRITFELSGTEAFIAQAQSRGYVQLASGLTATSHQHLVQAKQGNTVVNFSGPVAKDYLSASQAVVRPAASAKFSVHLKIEVDGLAGQGQATVDSFDLKLVAP